MAARHQKACSEGMFIRRRAARGAWQWYNQLQTLFNLRWSPGLDSNHHWDYEQSKPSEHWTVQLCLSSHTLHQTVHELGSYDEDPSLYHQCSENLEEDNEIGCSEIVDSEPARDDTSFLQVLLCSGLSILYLAPHRCSQALARQLGGIPLRHLSLTFL